MAGGQGRLFSPAFVALAISELAYFSAAGALLGVTPFLVTGPLGAGKLGLGLALGAFSVTTVVIRPLAGRMADRSGRRPLLLVGVGTFAAAIAAHLLVTELWMLILARLVLGAAESLFFVAGFATLADLAPAGRTGEALSWSSVSLYLGIALGPVVGQLLLDWRGFQAVWIGAALIAVLAFALVSRVPETGTSAPEDARPARLIHRAAIRPGLALFTGVAATAGFLALIGLRATEIDFPAWSAVPLIYGSVVVACRIFFARVPDRVPPLRLATAALLLCTVGLVVLATVPHAGGMVSGAVILGLGVAFLTPAIFAAVFAAVPAHERGAAAGTATIFIDLGFGAGTALLGFVAAGRGIPVAFLVAAVLTASGATLLFPLVTGRSGIARRQAPT